MGRRGGRRLADAQGLRNTVCSCTRHVGRPHQNQTVLQKVGSAKIHPREVETRTDLKAGKRQRSCHRINCRHGEGQTWFLRTFRNGSFPRSKPFQSTGKAGANPKPPRYGNHAGEESMGRPVPELMAGLGHTYSLCSEGQWPALGRVTHPIACPSAGLREPPPQREGRGRRVFARKTVLLRKPPETRAMRAPQTLPRSPYSSPGGLWLLP